MFLNNIDCINFTSDSTTKLRPEVVINWAQSNVTWSINSTTKTKFKKKAM